jgi:hypothetical protein
MAFPVVLKTYVEKISKIIVTFSKYHPGLVYTPETSLAVLIEKRDILDKLIDIRNEYAIKFSDSIMDVSKAEADLAKVESSFLTQTGDRFTKNSDEYVWAGGTRQSEAVEKRRVTLEENQRLEKLRIETEALQAKAEKERMEAEMAALKAEIERLKAQKG